MDSLDDLPIDDKTKSTTNEINLLQKYFKGEMVTGSKGNADWKFIIYATIVFAILSNPISETFLDYCPYTGSPLVKMAIKMMIFLVALSVVYISCKK
jgi:hypothetical protein